MEEKSIELNIKNEKASQKQHLDEDKNKSRKRNSMMAFGCKSLNEKWEGENMKVL